MQATIRPANADEMRIVRQLFLEYAESLGFSLCFQGFDQELAELPGKYALPDGLILLALAETEPVGVVGVRKLKEGICEMKRLYVKPSQRGTGLGRQLANEALQRARRHGYQLMRLDTLPNMQAARHLYQQLGFIQIPAYYDNSPCGSICMEKRLAEE
jgi:ribosomal protein S18 acetylase RimI-like enzyme